MGLEHLFNTVKTRFNGTAVPPYKCPRCQHTISAEQFEKNAKVCPSCNYHGRLTAFERLNMTVDEGSFLEFDADMISGNPINFPGYEEKQAETREKTGLKDAVITGTATIRGQHTVIGIMDSRFTMASMGSVVGEKLTRAVEYATDNRFPVIFFCASGGARMQEGIISLMQMAKTSGAVAKHSENGLLYISVLTDPTTGGVTASFASLGDIIIAEPKVLIGFAGRRVIEGTIKQRLPDTFQSAEFMLEKGFVDMLVERKKMPEMLAELLKIHNRDDNGPYDINLKEMPETHAEPSGLSAYERLELVRNKNRPTVREYIPNIFDGFIEMHGDRYYGDDGAIMGGIGRLCGRPVTVLAQVKGRNVDENKRSNFSMPHPEGYRKALRLAKQAEKFGRAVICLIDTPGAFCGIEAEARGQGEAIARNLAAFMLLRTPIVSVVLGEGGSGGALALGVCDVLGILENALYSVISPRGFANILWKDGSKEKEACELLKCTAEDLYSFGIADTVIPEPNTAAHTNSLKMSSNIKEFLVRVLAVKCEKDLDILVKERYTKFRKIGSEI